MRTPILNGLGQALRWLRDRQGKKQYQVAEAAGITKGMLSAYETGRQRPSLETLEKILDTLGCDLNDLHNAIQIINGRPEGIKRRGEGVAEEPETAPKAGRRRKVRRSRGSSAGAIRCPSRRRGRSARCWTASIASSATSTRASPRPAGPSRRGMGRTSKSFATRTLDQGRPCAAAPLFSPRGSPARCLDGWGGVPFEASPRPLSLGEREGPLMKGYP